MADTISKKTKKIISEIDSNPKKINKIILGVLKEYVDNNRARDIPLMISAIIKARPDMAADVLFVAINLTLSKQIGTNPAHFARSIISEALAVMPEEIAVSNGVLAFKENSIDGLEIAKILYRIINLNPNNRNKIIDAAMPAYKYWDSKAEGAVNFSNLILEIINMDPTPENIELNIKAAVRSALKEDEISNEYIHNIINTVTRQYILDNKATSAVVAGSISAYLEMLDEEGRAFDHSAVISDFLHNNIPLDGNVMKTVFLQYLLKRRPKKEIYELLSSLIDFEISLVSVDSISIDDILFGLYSAYKKMGDIDDPEDILLKLVRNKPECLEKIAALYIGKGDYVKLEKLLKAACTRMAYDEQILKRVYKIYAKNNLYKKMKNFTSSSISNGLADIDEIISLFLKTLERHGVSDSSTDILKIISNNQDDTRQILEAASQFYLDSGNVKEFQKLLNGVIDSIKERQVPHVIRGIIGILESSGFNDQKYEIIANLIKDNPDKAYTIMNEIASYYINANRQMSELYDFILGVSKLQRKEDNVDQIVGGAIDCMISNGKTDPQVYDFLLHAAHKINDRKFTGIIDGIELGFNAHERYSRASRKTIDLLSRLNADMPNIENLNFMIINRIATDVLHDTLSADSIDSVISKIEAIYSKVPDNKEKILEAKAVVTYQALAKYYFDLFTEGKEADKNTKSKILALFNETYSKSYRDLSEITFSNLEHISNYYYKIKFKNRGVSGERSYTTFPKLILDKKTANGDRITDKIHHGSFSDVLFTRMERIGEDSEVTREEFFRSKGLSEKDFGPKKSGEKSYKLVRCGFIGHAFLIAIDTSIPWEQAIDDNFDSMAIIDSSRVIQSRCNTIKMPDNFRKFFSNIKTISDSYQKNGTCWANATSGMSVISSECNTFNDILTGFGHRLRKGKIVQNGNPKLKPLQDSIILDTSLSFLPLLSKKYEVAGKSAIVASDTSSDNTSDEEYEELPRPLSPRPNIETIGKDDGIKLKLDSSDLFNKDFILARILKDLSERASEYEDKRTMLSMKRAIRFKAQDRRGNWKKFLVGRAPQVGPICVEA